MQNKVTNLDAIQTNLVDSLRLDSKIDLLVFNPPYVVTEDEEITNDHGISAAWAGGKDGRRILDRLLPQIHRLLSATGKFYLLTIDENKPDEIAAELLKQGFKCTIVLQRRAYNEKQKILRFERL